MTSLGRNYTQLWQMTHSSSDAAGAMPTPSLVNNKFWTKAQIGYGTAASVVANGYAYMYGATDDSKLAIGACPRTRSS